MKCCVCYIIAFLTFAINYSNAQCKTYSLDAKTRDTINCTDFQNRKQGKWGIRVVNNHGEPGYQEEGSFVDDKKEGLWVRYNLMGDVLAEEHYKWGNKDGVCKYYNLAGLVREESWKAINPENPYDTVRSYHLDNPDKYDLKVVKVDASTVKHGTWTYYDPERGTIIKAEDYVINQLVNNTNSNKKTIDSSASNSPTDSLSIANKNKPVEVLEYEKKNQKKKIKVRDGGTGVN